MTNTFGKIKSGMTFEEFVPLSSWSQDSTSHYLLVDLPGFKKEQVRLQVNNRGEILTSGEREVIINEKKYKRFAKTFKIPENSDIEKIRGKFEEEVLCVSIPKLRLPIEKGGKKSRTDKTYDWSMLEEAGAGGLLDNMVKNVKENKEIVVTALLAFSLGVLVAHKLRTNSN